MGRSPLLPHYSVLVKVFCRIDRKTVQAYFIMEVRAGAGTGITGIGDDIAPPDALTCLYVEARIVGIQRFDPVSVADLYHVSVARAEARLDHDAVGRGHDRRPGLSGDVQAFMEFENTAERRSAGAIP